MNKQMLEDGAEVNKMIRHMMLTLDPLLSDMDFAVAELNKVPQSQFWRRTLIRCMLAGVEALLWNLKHAIPKIAAISLVELTSREKEVVNEVRFALNKEGKSEARPVRLSFRENIKATFTLFAKVHGATLAWKHDPDFDAFCTTYELRNRLMHPKKPFDPNVFDRDVQAAQRGINWFLREYGALMKGSSAAVPMIVK